MKTLSIQQPFAQLIVRGIKRWELRTWGTDYRGRIAIHASAAAPSHSLVSDARNDPVLWEAFGAQDWDSRDDLLRLPRSAIVGTVDLVRVLPAREVRARRNSWARSSMVSFSGSWPTRSRLTRWRA